MSFGTKSEGDRTSVRPPKEGAGQPHQLLDLYDKRDRPPIGCVVVGPEIEKIIELRSRLDIFSSERLLRSEGKIP
ncbi:hypothetical protein TNCV_3073151 [Trichonephila clavipes]|nr:hypothetical protein TNCV_3073151 [Trichonephila clavipes]